MSALPLREVVYLIMWFRCNVESLTIVLSSPGGSNRLFIALVPHRARVGFVELLYMYETSLAFIHPHGFELVMFCFPGRHAPY